MKSNCKWTVTWFLTEHPDNTYTARKAVPTYFLNIEERNLWNKILLPEANLLDPSG